LDALASRHGASKPARLAAPVIIELPEMRHRLLAWISTELDSGNMGNAKRLMGLRIFRPAIRRNGAPIAEFRRVILFLVGAEFEENRALGANVAPPKSIISAPI
jgi:hypothetical protein